MPLSKDKNRERMKRIRLHKRLSDLIVQPKPIVEHYTGKVTVPSQASNCVGLDADGNPIYDD